MWMITQVDSQLNYSSIAIWITQSYEESMETLQDSCGDWQNLFFQETSKTLHDFWWIWWPASSSTLDMFLTSLATNLSFEPSRIELKWDGYHRLKFKEHSTFFRWVPTKQEQSVAPKFLGWFSTAAHVNVSVEVMSHITSWTKLPCFECVVCAMPYVLQVLYD